MVDSFTVVETSGDVDSAVVEADPCDCRWVEDMTDMIWLCVVDTSVIACSSVDFAVCSCLEVCMID